MLPLLIGPHATHSRAIPCGFVTKHNNINTRTRRFEKRALCAIDSSNELKIANKNAGMEAAGFSHSNLLAQTVFVIVAAKTASR